MPRSDETAKSVTRPMPEQEDDGGSWSMVGGNRNGKGSKNTRQPEVAPKTKVAPDSKVARRERDKSMSGILGRQPIDKSSTTMTATPVVTSMEAPTLALTSTLVSTTETTQIQASTEGKGEFKRGGVAV